MYRGEHPIVEIGLGVGARRALVVRGPGIRRVLDLGGGPAGLVQPSLQVSGLGVVELPPGPTDEDHLTPPIRADEVFVDALEQWSRLGRPGSDAQVIVGLRAGGTEDVDTLDAPLLGPQILLAGVGLASANRRLDLDALEAHEHGAGGVRRVPHERQERVFALRPHARTLVAAPRL